jgi:hypothetical protein
VKYQLNGISKVGKLVIDVVKVFYNGKHINDIERALNNFFLFGRVYGVYGGVVKSKYCVDDVINSYAPYEEFREMLEAMYDGDVNELILLLEDYYDSLQIVQEEK